MKAAKTSLADNVMVDRKSLVLGGIRSGKSAFTETQAQSCNRPVIYVATAQEVYKDGEVDAAWQQRIQAHRQRRPQHWQCIEEPLQLAKVLRLHSGDGHCVLVDCISVWMTNLLLCDDEAQLQDEKDALLDAVANFHGRLLMVSSESNMGVLPLGALSQRYCDEMGMLHQQLAARCEQVILIIAGLPHCLKGSLAETATNEEII